MTSGLEAGSILGSYRIGSLVAQGGFSSVFLAEDERLRRRVALKVLTEGLERDERFRERFLRESQLAASLEHPGIVPIYDAGEAERRLYIAMRYVEGTDLGRLLEGGPLEAPRTLSLLGQVAEALDVAHEAGLVHRDVKPSNVLIQTMGGREHAYLADFGISKRVSSATGLTGTGEFIGTVTYMAPEQIEGRTTDGRADVYSLGCVLFQCIAGSGPFVRDTDAALLWAHVHDAPPTCGRAELDPVLARALAKRPEERFATCRELIAAAGAALEPARVAEPVAHPAPSFAARAGLTTRLRRRRGTKAQDTEWRVRQLLPIAPTELRPHLVALGNTVFSAARTAHDVDRYVARFDPRVLRRRLDEVRKTAITETGAREADSVARQLAAVERLTDVRARLGQALASLEPRIDELRAAVFDARAGTMSIATLNGRADEIARGIQDPAAEADARYQEAVSEAALESGEKLRRTRRRGIYRQGSSYVVGYFDETGRERRRAFETIEGARAFRRSVKLAKPGAVVEAESGAERHTRHYVGELRDRQDRR